jgi:hypothetical protein
MEAKAAPEAIAVAVVAMRAAMGVSYIAGAGVEWMERISNISVSFARTTLRARSAMTVLASAD